MTGREPRGTDAAGGDGTVTERRGHAPSDVAEWNATADGVDGCHGERGRLTIRAAAGSLFTD